MLNINEAAQLLSNARDHHALGAIARTLSCEPLAAPIESHAREALGIDPTIPAAHIARGPGALRCICIQPNEGSDLRQIVTTLARRLDRTSPHLLWVILAARAEGDSAAIACWIPGSKPPRLAALIVDCEQVLRSDAETLMAMRDAASDDDLVTYHRWCELLGRESLTKRFYQTLAKLVTRLAETATPDGDPASIRELALLYVSRLLFLSFLETKGWLNRDRGFLSTGYADCMISGGRYQQRVLKPLFFGTLNTPIRRRAPRARGFGCVPFLNGGLFSRTPLERSLREHTFSDEALGDLYGELLTRYRFTAREGQTSWSESAIDPEMLGKAFESLMDGDLRKRSGAFYTPQPLVELVTEAALCGVLADCRVPEDVVRAALSGEPIEARARLLLFDRARHLRILDPACGSGAFLVHALEKVAALRGHLGDSGSIDSIRRSVLTGSIFGVDVNPVAVWLCELRLWLSAVIENPEDDPSRVAPLPNLDRNIRVGDSLAAEGFGETDSTANIGALDRITALRNRYARATGQRKHTLARALDREERARAIARLDHRIASATHLRRDLVLAARSVDLFGQRDRSVATRNELTEVRETIRSLRTTRSALAAGGALPFSYATRFADVARAGGFHLVIGNPPWVRPHNMSAVDRAQLRDRFTVSRLATWDTGARLSQAGIGFGSQVDVAALFLERSCDLLVRDGVAALLVPVKLWRALSGGGVRRLLTNQVELRRLEDLSDSAHTFDAATYPSLVVVKRRPTDAHRQVHLAIHSRTSIAEWKSRIESLGFDGSPGSPWVLAPPLVRRAFGDLKDSGTALGESSLGRPVLGVKTGLNEAFVVSACSAESANVQVSSGGREGWVERNLVRPVLKGESLSTNGNGRHPENGAREVILWTHDSLGPLRRLPPNAYRWFLQWRRELGARTDLHGERWWSLFRTEAADCCSARVVWADIARRPRVRVLQPGDPTVPLNTCYVVACANALDAYALAALLVSPTSAAWLNVIAEPARGGYRRYVGWTVSLLPLPRSWAKARETLAPFGQAMAAGLTTEPQDLFEATLAAYDLKAETVIPLLEWADS
jgi:hypothetical protein